MAEIKLGTEELARRLCARSGVPHADALARAFQSAWIAHYRRYGPSATSTEHDFEPDYEAMEEARLEGRGEPRDFDPMGPDAA